jgi:sulfur dioxygenase
MDVAARVQVLDVRESEEFNGPFGHIPGAQALPLGELAARHGELQHDRPVVAVCRSGARSARAVALLQQAGFRDVANLAGGMLRWRVEGGAVVGGSD